MKKFVPFVAAVMLAVSFTAFSSFKSTAKTDPIYYFLTPGTTDDWNEYEGDVCQPAGSTGCQISNPLPGQTGSVQLYYSQNSVSSNRVLRN